jgi:hypothetical protein
MIFYNDKKGEIFKPGGVLQAKCLERLAVFPVFEGLISQFEQSGLIGNRQGEVAAPIRKQRYRLEVFSHEKAFFDQEIRADEDLISCKGRDAAIRGIPIDRISQGEGQHLPKVLPGFDKKIDECVSFRPQISDAIRRRQRSYMQEDACSSSCGYG